MRIEGQFASGLNFSSSSFLTFRDLSISGATLAEPKQVTAGISLNNVSDVQILNNHLEGNGLGSMGEVDTGDIFLSYGGCSRVQILGNTCVSTGVNFNIGLFNARSCRIEGNTVANANAGTDLYDGGYGIVLYRTKGETTTAEGNVITGNIVRDTQGSGIYVQGNTSTVVADNVVENACSVQIWGSLLVAGIAVSEGDPSTPAAVTISGNVVRNSYQDGIAIHGRGLTVLGNMVEGSARRGIWLHTVTASTVMGNSIRNCNGGIHNSLSDPGTEGVTIVGNSIWGGKSGTSLGGIELFNITASIVANNVVAEAQGFGIVIDGSRNIVAGNIVRDASQLLPNSAAGYDGLYLRGSASCHNMVLGNQIYGTARHGILVGGFDHQLLGNDVTWNTNKGIYVAGTRIVARNNQGSIQEVTANALWTTENRGTGTIAWNATGSGPIAHELSVAPDAFDFTITALNNPATDPGLIWVTVDGASFTVHCRNQPGQPDSKTDLSLAWQVNVRDNSVTCGNGTPDPGEDCDDGVESANCDCDCTFVVCGDGTLNQTAGEECDDGDGDNLDSCPDGDGGTCVPAYCGDGFVWNMDGGTEQCDDGGTDPGDGCDQNCQIE